MFDIWWGEIELTTLTLIISILVLFPAQLLLCFKVEGRIKRLLPIIILSVIELVLIYVYFATSGLEGLVYLILAIFVGFMIFMCIFIFHQKIAGRSSDHHILIFKALKLFFKFCKSSNHLLSPYSFQQFFNSFFYSFIFIFRKRQHNR